MDDIENIKVGEPFRIRGPTRNMAKLKKYIEDVAKQDIIIDLGEF